MAERQATLRARDVQVGDTIGTLLMVSTYMESDPSGKKRRFWVCRCNVCGLERPVYAQNLPSYVGKPCRCTRGWSDKPEYGVWQAMLTRCYNPNGISYPTYGAVGIFTCKRWRESSNAFLIDMGDRPSDEHSIDRIDSKGGYTCGKCDECKRNDWPANCRWATLEIQSRNHSRNRYYSHGGKTLVLTDWANLVGLKVATLDGRLARGWSFEDAISTPTRRLIRKQLPTLKQTPS